MAKLPANGARVCCPKCQKIFVIKRPPAVVFNAAAMIKKVGQALSTSTESVSQIFHLITGKTLNLINQHRLEIVFSLILVFELFSAAFCCHHHHHQTITPIISAQTDLKPAIISQELLHQVIAEMKTHELVGDAVISQENEQFFLALLVNRAAPSAWAIQIGNQFRQAVNQVAGLWPKRYYFHLHIYYPDGREINQTTSF